MKFEYETNEERLEQELILQKSEAENLRKDSIISSNRKQLYLSGLLLLLSVIIIGLGLKNNRSKRKSNAELSRVNNLLSVNKRFNVGAILKLVYGTKQRDKQHFIIFA